MEGTPSLHGMQACIDACLDCYRTCLDRAMNHCLVIGGRHVEPSHFRLMRDCAEICRTAADFMLAGSTFHARVCGLCAETCEACAASCEELGDMGDCVQVCRACSQICREMAQAGGGRGYSRNQRQESDTPVKAPM